MSWGMIYVHMCICLDMYGVCGSVYPLVFSKDIVMHFLVFTSLLHVYEMLDSKRSIIPTVDTGDICE